MYASFHEIRDVLNLNFLLCRLNSDFLRFYQSYTLKKDLFVQIELNMSMSIFMDNGVNTIYLDAAKRRRVSLENRMTV